MASPIAKADSAAAAMPAAQAARRAAVDVLHAPHYVVPITTCPVVVTIHDLIHLRFPPRHRHPFAPLYARVMLRLAVRRGRRLILDVERLQVFGCLLDDVIGKAADQGVAEGDVDERHDDNRRRAIGAHLFAIGV